MKLGNLKITVVKVEGPCTRSKEGTVYYVRNGRLEMQSGSGICLFALGSILQPLIAASIPTNPESDLLNVTREFQCPDPLAEVIFRIEEE